MRRTDVPYAAALALALGLGSCTIGHKTVGNTVRAAPEVELVIGTTTRSEVLRVFGPPDKLIRRPDGDAFLYVQEREESESFRIREPIILRQDLYSWTDSDSRSDRLLILFDETGTVVSYGFRKGTAELDE
jgi:hypothetical protein